MLQRVSASLAAIGFLLGVIIVVAACTIPAAPRLPSQNAPGGGVPLGPGAALGGANGGGGASAGGAAGAARSGGGSSGGGGAAGGAAGGGAGRSASSRRRGGAGSRGTSWSGRACRHSGTSRPGGSARSLGQRPDDADGVRRVHSLRPAHRRWRDQRRGRQEREPQWRRE